MALIKCPECGKEISDKAQKCIHCGYPLKSEQLDINITSDEDVKKASKSENNSECSEVKEKKRNKKKIIIPIMVVVLLLICISGIFIITKNKNNVNVSKIDISKWKLLSEETYYDEYEGTISADETKPFVAVLGYYNKDDRTPTLVFVEDGKGTIQTTVLSDEDPSLKYKAIGYIDGKKVDESVIKNIEYNDSDYDDWSYNTSCTVTIDIEMNKKVTGILFLELSNDLTNNIDRNVAVVIINGVGHYNYSLSDLPLKSRGVEVTAVPKFFCESVKVKAADFNTDKYTIEKNEYEYLDTTGYTGKTEMTFKDFEDGLILYTEELLDGGNRKDIGKVIGNATYLQNQQCIIQTYTFGDSDSKILKPKYDIRIRGYLRWNSLKKL